MLGGAALFGLRSHRSLLALQDKVELQFWHQWAGPPNRRRWSRLRPF